MSLKTEEVVQRVADARADLLKAVSGLSPAQLEYRPRSDPEAWSITEVLHHLALTDEACAKLLARFLRQAEESPPPPDPDPGASVLDSLDGRLAGADGGKAEAPEIVVPKEKIDAEQALARLEVSREKIVARFDALSAFDLTSLTFPHPFFGELDGYQWVLVTGWHERRHTRQIERIKADSDFPES